MFKCAGKKEKLITQIMSKFRKILAAFLVVATLTAGSPAFAVTIEELLAQITALQAQITSLQGGDSGSGYAGMLTKTLKQGMSDAEVTILQKGLAMDTAVYPQALVTGYFGPLTYAAVVKFQEKYASEILSSWGLTKGTGLVGSTTRAKFNALYGSSMPASTPTPGVSPAPAGSVSVAISPVSPGATTLIADSTTAEGAQALASVAAFRFTAPASGAVKVTSMRVNRTGVSSDADISNMYLYVDGVRVGEAPSISTGYFTFTNSSGLFTVSAGSYKDVVVKIDLANGTTSGKTMQFGLMAASDVSSDAASIAGTFPMSGNVMSTAQVSDLGRITIQSAIPSSNGTVDAGVTDYEVFRFSAVASDQPQKVSYMRFSLIGTADYDALQNLKLYVDGVQVGSTMAMMSTDKSVAFDLSGAPLAFTSGQTKTVSLRADVVKGSGRSFYFQVGQSADFVAMDTTYNVYLKTNQANVWSLFKAAGTTTINEGSIVVTRSTASPTGPLSLNATNMEIARFDVKAVGEDIRVSSLLASVDDSANLIVSNLKVLVEGSQLGSTVSAPVDAAINTFSGNYTFPAGVTKTVTIVADLTGTLTTSSVITATLEDNNTSNGVKLTSGASLDVPSSDQSGNAISISSGSLAATKNPSIANITTVISAQNIVLGSWMITAPAEQAIRINSVTVEDNGAEGLGNAFSNLTLWVGSTQYGQTISSPSTTTGGDNVFNFSTGLQISAGQSIQVDLKGNVLSSASTSIWESDASDAASISSIDATGLTTNSAVTYGSGEVAGQIIDVTSGATLTIANEASPTMSDSTYIVAGDTSQTMAAWKFTASNAEDVSVTRVKVFESGAISGEDNPGNLKNIKLYVDGVPVGSTVPAFTISTATSATNGWTMDYALFENSNGLFTVSKNSSKTVVVKADATDNTNAVFEVDGSHQRFSLQVTDGAATSITNVSAKGSTSSQYVTLESGSSATNELNGNYMALVKTKPTLAYVAPSSSTLTPGTMEVFRFKITADSHESVVFNTNHVIRLTVLAGKTATGTVTLKNASTGTIYASSTANSLASAATISFAFDVNTLTIGAGGTTELVVEANLSAFTATGDAFQVRLDNAAADFSWSDNTTSAVIEEANFVGIGLPMTGGVFVKPGA